MLQRDIFISEITKAMKKDKNIFFLAQILEQKL